MTRHRGWCWSVAAAGALSALAVGGCGSARGGEAARAAHGGSTSNASGPAGGYSPQTLQRAYGVTALLREGIDGRGETVVLPEQPQFSAPGDSRRTARGVIPRQGSDIRQDLAAFDQRYHLPRAELTLVPAFGYPGDLSLAGGEEVLDAETVHAIAPGARITVMLSGASATSSAGLGSWLRAAAARGNIVSLSYSGCEPCLSAGQLRSVNLSLGYARDRHVSMIAATGDFGADGESLDGPASTRGVGIPAASPLVTAVGGTQLVVRSDGAYESESVWNANVGHGPHPSLSYLAASGGGVSARYARPGYQHGLPVIGGHRGVPDVAADAAFPSGLSLVQVAPDGHEVITRGGGTSQSAPLWAGIAALADQDARRQLGFLNQGLYRIGHSALYHRAFHDITRGNNSVTLPSGKRITGYRARPGWDPATGWGSPNAQVLVPLLGREVHPGDGR